MAQHQAGTAAQEWRTGWGTVLAASVGFSFFSVMLSGTGIFMQPLGEEFGWSRTMLSAGPSIATTMVALLSPFFGILIDRYGSRRLALPGLVVTSLVMAAFSTIDGASAQYQWLALWSLFGLVSVSIKSTIWNAAVASIFEKGRGLALGLTLSGTAVAQAVVPPLGNWLIEDFGWRDAYVWMALGWGGLTFLVCLLLFYDAHDHAAAERRRTQPEAAAVARGAQANLTGLSVQEALRSAALWRLAISTFIIMLVTMGLSIHLFPILTEAGVSRTNAAWMTAISGIAGIVGKLVTGVLLDRYRPNWVGGLTMGVTALAFLLLIDGISAPVLIIIAMVVNGYAAGTKMQIAGYLTAGYGGMKNFGKIYGAMSALVSLASGLGPMVGGAIYDLTGGYELFLIIGAVACTIGGALLVSLPAYPVWAKPEDAEQAAEALA